MIILLEDWNGVKCFLCCGATCRLVGWIEREKRKEIETRRRDYTEQI